MPASPPPSEEPYTPGFGVRATQAGFGVRATQAGFGVRATQAGFVAVVGASAGGVTALRTLIGAIPVTFAGALCVVLHLAADRPSYLANILARAAVITVDTAHDGEPLQAGRAYVAPPDHHLVVEDGHLRLLAAPPEHGHRPAIDVLFRSAARAFGPAAVGVVLSGSLDDGAAGLREIKAHGGRAAVQHPDDADYPAMPRAALDAVRPDLLGTAAEIGRWLADPSQRGESTAAPPPAGPAPEGDPSAHAVDPHRGAV